MRYELWIDGTKHPRTFRRKHDAIFAAKYALHRENASEATIFAMRPDGTLAGHFVVTIEE